MMVMTTRMFTHTGPRRGDVFAESTFAKQIALIEAGLLPPVVQVGNLDSLRTIADVRDAVRAYHMLLTIKPVAGAYYNIGGTHQTTVREILDSFLALSPKKDEIRIEIDPARLRPIDADLQVPDTTKFRRHTGWAPEIPYERTIGDLLDYWRKRVSREGDRFLRR
jgi:GDP-D-mannose dehydratase